LRKIETFLGFLILFSAPFWWLAREYGGAFYFVGMMYAPGAAALATVKLTSQDLSELGWRGSRFRWVILAWLLTIGAIAVANLSIIIAGEATFPDVAALSEAVDKRGMANWSPGGKALIYALLFFTVGMVGLTANALGEEVGWRGFLTPQAYQKWGFTGSSLFVGVLWGAWHLPIMIGRAPPSIIPPFIIGIVAISFGYTWFRLASQSVWPAVIMHGAHNTAFAYWGSLMVSKPDSIWAGEEGYALVIVYCLVGFGFWRHRHKAEALYRESESARLQTSLRAR
jgi:membrane protease YdiL (CAAX protease family)